MKNKKNWLKEFVPYIVILIIVLIIKQFAFTTVIVHGASMENTLYDKDIMLLDKIGTRINGIHRFDIVVIDLSDSKIIKRVIGLPGETVEYKDDKLYINGKVVKDKYGSEYTADIEEVKLGDDQYYVLGDNRINSVDSRIIGPVNKKDIMGHARFIIFPFNRFGSR